MKVQQFYKLGLICMAAILGLLCAGGITRAMAQSYTRQRYVMLVIDQSFSMLNAEQSKTPAQLVGQFVQHAHVDCPNCWLGMMVFGDQVTQSVEIQPLEMWDKMDMERLGASKEKLGYGTNYVEAIRRAAKELENIQKEGIERRIVLLTDTKFDKVNYPNQPEELKMAVASLVDQEIQLVVIDNDFSNGEKMWWAEINQTGGWYSRGGSVDPSGYISRTLRWAIGKEPDPISINQRKITRTFAVEPYQEQAVWGLVYSGTIIPIFVSPEGKEITAKQSRQGDFVNLVVDSPTEGKWTVYITGTGVFRLDLVEQTPRRFELALRDGRQSQQMLPTGAPVTIELVLRDVRDKNFLVDEAFPVMAQLADERGVGQGPVQVSFDKQCKCYHVTRQNVTGLNGEYWIQAWVDKSASPRLEMPISLTTPARVVWGPVPQFADSPKVNEPDIKINQAFSVAVRLVDLQAIDDPQVDLELDGANNFQFITRMVCDKDKNLCYTQIPSQTLTFPGMYTPTAVLYGGYTQQQVRYERSASPAARIVVRDLNLPEWTMAHLWQVGVAAALCILVVLALALIFNLVINVRRTFFAAWQRDPGKQREIYNSVRKEVHRRRISS